ncbi:Hsp20/alpha crystallin family protein [Rickettsia prowazekii]|uniref:Small heat shock protein C1 n=2 Tax=Rickettsia prowazekii TaxID=782 RepID=HSPC1_RICPR|nr:Hsp20/alpha crystallin family protein [Rickettsia prowazekii]Q9ZDQ3.1 RecName: Full=Small heat shock protein C1 [Rickettsia prowazekii str. Madrid E]ADE29786.1 Small heat shock protein [Rickettsia prowazekii str. Rp22]AFE49092.1 small heat shock protein [Rickettsia prowazekii str. Chernikova]AFE49937.1 small heat shock protein [Rickettsia prowazekii str. Katsinyian]AFE50781.1 small heat shock protein [Rickettsia prowazekii str. BuV67-CWPP]AFE51620.1 small heat shock protein [Rickettsia pro
MLKYIPAIFAIILSSNIAIASKNYDYISLTPLRHVADLIDSHITNIDHLFNNRLTFYESSSLKSKFITKDKQYIIVMEVPGFDKSQIKVKLNGKKLFIAGNIEDKNKANDSDNYMNKNFNYVISLYEDVDQKSISARLKNGILTIILPRIEVKEQDSREITIN